MHNVRHTQKNKHMCPMPKSDIINLANKATKKDATQFVTLKYPGFLSIFEA